MKNRFKINKKEVLIKVIVSTCLLALLFLSFLFSSKIEKALGLRVEYNTNQVASTAFEKSNYAVHYIDVGQGNSVLIQLPDGKSVLIDGGNTLYGEVVEAFLKDKNIYKIDYLIASHADADHIGGLNHVLDNFEVKNIYRPFQIAGTGSSAATFQVFEDEDLGGVYEYYQDATNGRSKISRVTSNVYKDFISRIYDETYLLGNELKSSTVTVFYDGLKISGYNYEIEFFAPFVREDSINLDSMCTKTLGYATKGYGVSKSNDNSAVFLFSVGDDKFLFTGDAACSASGDKNPKPEKYEELDFVASLSREEKELFAEIDVFLAGHHGSVYSSSQVLIDLINPSFVVVSVGANNTYGHPSVEVLNRFGKSSNIESDGVLRTDKVGDISFVNVDGNVKYVLKISSDKEKFLISWELLSSVTCAALILLVVFIKPKSHQR